MKTVVLGCGYVGLAYVALLSERNKIVAFDVDEEKIRSLKTNALSLTETELTDSLKKNSANIEYKFYDNSANLKDAEVFFLCLPTNYSKKMRQLDTSILTDVISRISAQNKKALIIIKSTIPMGYTDKMIEKTQNRSIVFMPEFLREGKSLFDVKNPSRIILGCEETSRNKAINTLKKIGLLGKDVPFLYMGCKEAESVKLFSNTYLAMRIAFFNELDTFCLQNNLNTKNIIEGVCADDRIGNHYNNPSFGFGGYCLEKDTNQCAQICKNPTLINSIVKSNDRRRKDITEGIAVALQTKRKRTVGIYKLDFKKDSDNIRNSVMIKLIKDLQKKNIKVTIFDPKVKQEKFLDCKVEKNFKKFVSNCGLVVTNRFDSKTKKLDHVFCRDVFEIN